MKTKETQDLAELLRDARARAGLSQADVAEHLGLMSAQSVSDWERGRGSGIPVPALKKLIRLYKLDTMRVFEVLLESQTRKLEEKMTRDFFGADAPPAKKKRRRA